jgi:hypothetical protein
MSSAFLVRDRDGRHNHGGLQGIYSVDCGRTSVTAGGGCIGGVDYLVVKTVTGSHSQVKGSRRRELTLSR